MYASHGYCSAGGVTGYCDCDTDSSKKSGMYYLACGLSRSASTIRTLSSTLIPKENQFNFPTCPSRCPSKSSRSSHPITHPQPHLNRIPYGTHPIPPLPSSTTFPPCCDASSESIQRLAQLPVDPISPSTSTGRVDLSLARGSGAGSRSQVCCTGWILSDAGSSSS